MNRFEQWWAGTEHNLGADIKENMILLSLLKRTASSIWEAFDNAAWGEWQPIETAPIGIWCLFLDGRGTMEAAIYGHAVHVDKVLQKADNEPIHETFYNYYHNYTHWMPLPQPPK